MRIYSNFLERSDVRKAARIAGVTFTRFDLTAARKRDQRFDVILSGDSPRRQNGGEDMAATWDQWGHFLSIVFSVDEHAIAGHYENAEHFHWMTGGRFRDFDRADDHVKGHRWGRSDECVTGAYHVAECPCGATQRWLRARTWAEFQAASA